MISLNINGKDYEFDINYEKIEECQKKISSSIIGYVNNKAVNADIPIGDCFNILKCFSMDNLKDDDLKKYISTNLMKCIQMCCQILTEIIGVKEDTEDLKKK
jgi:hypothetical protein